MKLHIMRSVSDSSKRFSVTDSAGNPFVNIESNPKSTLNKLYAYDSEGKVLFKISITPEVARRIGYNVVTPSTKFAVSAKLLSGGVSFKIHGIKLYIKGNLLSHTFEITDVSSTVLAIHKPEAGKSGRYTLDVLEDSFCLTALSIAICADILSFSDSVSYCRA